jgi:hypothetical protein
MTALHPARLVFAILAVAVLTAAAACCLPDNPYQRWQLLDGTIHADARWIYERLEFDPKPIDVLVIGQSRTEIGVNAPRLSLALAAAHLPSEVVNASLAEHGRNLSDVIVREVLRKKHPRLIIIGVSEQPSRFGHPAFKYLAPAARVVNPGYLADFNYFEDLIYLPYRQISLFFANLAPGLSGLTKTFDPRLYRGSSIIASGPRHGRSDNTPAPMDELLRGVRVLQAGLHAPILPERYADLEFGDERSSIRDIATLARARGIKVVFLFVPYYTAKPVVQGKAFYEQFGPIWNADYLAPHAEWFYDYAHLTRTGGEHLTDWLATCVAAEFSSDTSSPNTGPLSAAPSTCGEGLTSR